MDDTLKFRIHSEMVTELKFIAVAEEKPLSQIARDILEQGVQIYYGDISDIIGPYKEYFPEGLIEKMKEKAAFSKKELHEIIAYIRRRRDINEEFDKNNPR